MVSVWHQSTARAIRKHRICLLSSLSQYCDVIHWPFCAAPLKVERAYSCLCVMLWLVALVMCLVSHWLVCVMWPSLFDNYSPRVANRLDFMWRKDRLKPDKSNAFWLEHLSDFDRRCSRLTITCAIKVPWEQNETSRRGQALQLL